MKLTFLGTRGEIDVRTRRHRMHSSLAVSYHGCEIMIDCGLDWLRRIHRMRPQAIMLTHAHPDHAWGLKNGSPCRVYATKQTWDCIRAFPVADCVTIKPRTPFQIGGIMLEAFPVEHSIRAPAAGYRVTAGRTTIFYVPDVVYIYEPHAALRDIRLYIGDGATLRRPLIRKRNGSLIGHATVRTQLGWYQCEGVRTAVITHCGSEIVAGDAQAVNVVLRDLAGERGIEARVAFDGMEVVLP